MNTNLYMQMTAYKVSLDWTGFVNVGVVVAFAVAVAVTFGHQTLSLWHDGNDSLQPLDHVSTQGSKSSRLL